MKATRYKIALVLSLLSLPAMLLVAIGEGRRRRLRTAAPRALSPHQTWGHSSQPLPARPRPAAPAVHLLTRPVPHSVYGASVRRASPGAGARSRWTGRGRCH